MDSKIDINKNPITTAFVVSSLIIKVHNENDKELDLLKLLKLLYICFGCISAEEKRYLFNERIEAWELGPVVADIYFHVRYYADYLNKYRIREVISDKMDSKMSVPESLKNIYSNIKEISKHYFTKKSADLINITHAKNSPWDKIHDGTPSKEIPKDDIVNYYRKLFYPDEYKA